MARRVVRARVEAELRRPWLRCADTGAGGYLRGPAVVREGRRRVWDAPLPEGVPLPEIPDESGRGRWKLDNHRQEIEFGDDPDYLEWDVAPADAPAQDSYDVPDGERGVRRRTVYYDPAVTQVTRGDIAKHEIRHNVSAQQNSITDFDLPAGMIWRGMSHEEWEAAKANGYIESNGSYNLGDENSYQRGRTYFSTRPESAALYATGYAPWQFQPSFSRPGHVVAIPDRPDVARGALGEGSADQSEVGVPGRIPFDQVAQHYVARPFAIFPGRAWTQKGWDGWESRAGGSNGMYRWSPEHPVRTAGRRTAGEGDWHSRAERDDQLNRLRQTRDLRGPREFQYFSEQPTSAVVEHFKNTSARPAYRDSLAGELGSRAVKGDPEALEAARAVPGLAGHPDYEWYWDDFYENEDDDDYREGSRRPAAVLPDGVHGPAEPTYDPSAAPYYEEPKPAPEGASWYHVTEERFKPGDTLVPSGSRSVFDEDGFYDSPDNKGRKRWVWMEPALDKMQTWISEIDSRGGRPTRIYRVRPHTAPQPWEQGSGGWVAGGADVEALVPAKEVERAYSDKLRSQKEEQDEYLRSGQSNIDQAIYAESARLWRIEHGQAMPSDLEGPDKVWGKYLPAEFLGDAAACDAAIKRIQRSAGRRTAAPPRTGRRVRALFVEDGDETDYSPAVPAGLDGLYFWRRPGSDTAYAGWRDRGRHPDDGDYHVQRAPYEAPIGHIQWYGENDEPGNDPGEVSYIETDDDWRRRGVATELFKWVKSRVPGLQLSDQMTGQGHEWSRSMGWDPAEWELMRTSRRLAGIRFERPATEPRNWAYAIDDEPSEDDSGRPLGAGEPVAELCWDPHSGEVHWVQTRKNRRRQGIGRDLFNWVRENHQPDLRHSDDLSDDGRAFAEAVAALRTARALLRACGGRR